MSRLRSGLGAEGKITRQQQELPPKILEGEGTDCDSVQVARKRVLKVVIFRVDTRFEVLKELGDRHSSS